MEIAIACIFRVDYTVSANHPITIEHCNSLDSAVFSLTSGALNIKYGPNGIGKSTLSKALEASIKGEGLLGLLPFKHRASKTRPTPSVSGADAFTTISVFNEDYVSQFVFQQDEVVQNSFAIFVKTADYDKEMAKLDSCLAGVRKAFAENVEVEQAIKDLSDLRAAVSVTRNGEIARNSKIHKALGNGNKIEHIPATVSGYELFLRSPQPYKWIEWQTGGNIYLQLGDQCPYCSKELKETAEKSLALAVAEEYDVSSISHLNALEAVIARLKKYFSPGCLVLIENLLKSNSTFTLEEVNFLRTLISQIDTLITKLTNVRNISFYTLRDVDELRVSIEQLKFNLELLDKLDSEATHAVVDPLNIQLDSLLSRLTDLTASISIQKGRVRDAIRGNESQINAFLKNAGYRYEVRIVATNNSYRMELVHQDYPNHIPGASKHLSYGEKNAFALVLFLHQVNHEKPDLVVLDDPISSFDKTKKFAILNEMFRGKSRLKNTTILLLTHDLEPALDLITIKGLFDATQRSLTFIKNRRGALVELPVVKADIQTFASICKEHLSGSLPDIIKAIYLRRHYEILGSKTLEYNLLANALHGREIPTLGSAEGSTEMSATEQANALIEIHKLMPNFNYRQIVNSVNDRDYLRALFHGTDVGYEKLQLYRLIKGERVKPEGDVVAKFVNETFHIENEYILQLDPHRFDSVPEYVVQACTEVLDNHFLTGEHPDDSATS